MRYAYSAVTAVYEMAIMQKRNVIRTQQQLTEIKRKKCVIIIM